MGQSFTDWFKKCADDYIFSIWYKLIHFSLPLNPALHRMGTNLDSLCPRCKEREESHPHFIFLCRLSQITLDLINKLINLNYTLRTLFKISIKDILMETSSHTNDCVKLEILQTLSMEMVMTKSKNFPTLRESLSPISRNSELCPLNWV